MKFNLKLIFNILVNLNVILFYFFPFIFISWRLITLQYCSGFDEFEFEYLVEKLCIYVHQ